MSGKNATLKMNDSNKFCVELDPDMMVDRPAGRAYRSLGSTISEHARRPVSFSPSSTSVPTAQMVPAVPFSTVTQITGRKRKRQKIRDQMKGAFDSPPDICNDIRGDDTFGSVVNNVNSGSSVQINGLSGVNDLSSNNSGLTYRCPSKSTPGENHRVDLKIEDGVTRFSCTCDHMGGRFDASKSSCSHIRATVIKIMMDLINTHVTAMDVDDITRLMSAMMV